MQARRRAQQKDMGRGAAGHSHHLADRLEELRILVDDQHVVQARIQADRSAGEPRLPAEIYGNLALGGRGRRLLARLKRYACAPHLGAADQFFLPLLDEVIGHHERHPQPRLPLRREGAEHHEGLDCLPQTNFVSK